MFTFKDPVSHSQNVKYVNNYIKKYVIKLWNNVTNDATSFNPTTTIKCFFSCPVLLLLKRL